MPRNKMSFGQRVKAFFGGVPVIQNIDWGNGDGIAVTEYKDKDQQIKANVGWVFAASQVIADECASIPIKLIHKMKDGDDEEVFEHPVLDLLNNPNAVLSAKQFWNLYYSYLNLTGEAYILKLDRSGKPLENTRELPTALFPLPSHLCQFVLGEKSYDQSHVVYGGVAYPIQAVLRDLNPDPENYYNGMSIVRKASLTIDTDIQMKRWNNKMFKNNGRPGSVVSFKQALSDDEFKRAKQMYNEQYAGTDNAFRNIILDNGATVTPFMMSTQDLDFLASKAFTRDEILAMFKVSTSNLGIVEDTNRASATTQEYGFRKRCVKPRLEQMVDFINQRLLFPIYHGEYVLDFGDILPEDTEKKLQEAQAGVNKWLTIDEVRERYDLEPLPDGLGSQIYGQLSMVPLDELKRINETTPSSDETTSPDDAQGGSDDENGNEPDDTPETPTNPPETPQNENADLDENEERKKLGNAKAQDYDRRRLPRIRQIQRVSRRMFDDQKSDALKWLDEHAKSLNNFVFTKDWADDMIDWAGYKSQFAQDIEVILQAIVEEIGTAEFERLMGEGNGAFDPQLREIVKYLETNANQNSISVNDETQKQIKATLKEGISGKESIEKLKARVSQVFGTASSQRAYKIALTETALAQNYADVEAWKQTGIVAEKEWFTAEDASVCGWCREMDGKRVKLGELFFEKGDWLGYTDDNGKEHSMKLDYRDMGEPPLHPECRCVLLPVLA